MAGKPTGTWWATCRKLQPYNQRIRVIEPCITRAFQVVPVIKNPPDNARDIKDVGLIPGSGRSPGEGHGNPFQYSCLENPMDRGAWQAIAHGVAELDTTEVT